MNADLETRITDWKKIQSSHKEVRSVTTEKSKSNDGEFELSLKMSVRVVDMSQSENVSMIRKIRTTGQSLTGGNDVELFNEAARLLEKEFSSKCGTTYKRLSRLSNGGDVERNPYN